MKNTIWYEPSAAAPACFTSWLGDELPPVVMTRSATRCSWACRRTSVICSTPVVRRSVSPPALLIFVSWALMSVAA